MRSIHREPIKIVLPCNSRVKKWAFDHALLLLFSYAVLIGLIIALFVMGVYAYAKG